MTTQVAVWGWFLFRLVAITVTATGTAVGGAFWVADYVTTKSQNGFVVAATNLQASFNNLDATVKRLAVR